MDEQLDKIKDGFGKIKDLRIEVNSIFDLLEQRIIKLNKTYTEFVKNNNENLFVFGLDSFKFQSKFIDIEYNDMKRLFFAISNRMYCEYYKLYKIVSDYIKTSVNDKKILDLLKINNKFPIYKDLEPFKQYSFDVIQDIHENIIMLVSVINDFIIIKHNELISYQKKQDVGFNINNFVSTFNYNISLMKENGVLFISYLDFCHNLHTKYLKRFATKVQLMNSQINHDIQFEDNVESVNKNILDNLEEDSIASDIVNELRKSFDSDDGILYDDNYVTKTDTLDNTNIIQIINKCELTNSIDIEVSDTDIMDKIVNDVSALIQDTENEENVENVENVEKTKKRPNRKKKK